MRILYLHQYFNTPRMSGGTRSYDMARKFIAAGHEVHMVTSVRDPERTVGRWYETDEDGIRVHWLPVEYTNTMSFGRRLRAFFRFAWAARRRAASIPADVVFATSTPLTIAVPGAHAAGRQGIPLVFELRDMWPELPIAVGALRNRLAIRAALALEGYAYSRSHRVVAFTERMKSGVARTGFPPERITVIPNGSDVPQFTVDPDEGARFLARNPHLIGGPLVVYAGTLGQVNDVGYLVRVAAAVRDLDPTMRFLIIGSGREREKVRATAVNLGVLGRNLFMMEPVAKDEMPRVLSAAAAVASLFVDIPQLSDGFGNKAFDGLAAGRPLVINHRGWLEGILAESGAGITMPPEDPREGARRLAGLLGDRTRVAAAGEAARDLAVGTYSRDILGARLLRVLERSVAEYQGLEPKPETVLETT